MTAIGLAIMIVAGVVTVDVVLENTRNTDASVVGQTIANVDLGGFFTAGVLVGVALMIGLMLLLAGLRRARQKRLERKELVRSYEGTAAQAETLQQERDRLAAELESERRARASERGGQEHADGRGDVPVGAGSGAGTATSDTRSRPAGEAPVYPGDAAGTGTGATAAGPATATQDHPKPSVKDRLLGR
jgi:hypothetical protein